MKLRDKYSGINTKFLEKDWLVDNPITKFDLVKVQRVTFDTQNIDHERFQEEHRAEMKYFYLRKQ